MIDSNFSLKTSTLVRCIDNGICMIRLDSKLTVKPRDMELVILGFILDGAANPNMIPWTSWPWCFSKLLCAGGHGVVNQRRLWDGVKNTKIYRQ